MKQRTTPHLWPVFQPDIGLRALHACVWPRLRHATLTPNPQEGLPLPSSAPIGEESSQRGTQRRNGPFSCAPCLHRDGYFSTTAREARSPRRRRWGWRCREKLAPSSRGHWSLQAIVDLLKGMARKIVAPNNRLVLGFDCTDISTSKSTKILRNPRQKPRESSIYEVSCLLKINEIRGD